MKVGHDNVSREASTPGKDVGLRRFDTRLTVPRHADRLRVFLDWESANDMATGISPEAGGIARTREEGQRGGGLHGIQVSIYRWTAGGGRPASEATATMEGR